MFFYGFAGKFLSFKCNDFYFEEKILSFNVNLNFE